jgi:hypothetical protein
MSAIVWVLDYFNGASSLLAQTLSLVQWLADVEARPAQESPHRGPT